MYDSQSDDGFPSCGYSFEPSKRTREGFVRRMRDAVYEPASCIRLAAMRESIMSNERAAARSWTGRTLTAFGFATCRAWIVVCLAASVVQADIHDANWLYLAMGAIASMLVALCAEKGMITERFHEHLANGALVLAVIAAAGVPVSLALQSAPLAFVAFMAGGVSAGILQILWGERFVAHSTRGVVFCSAAATIVTALLIALFPSHLIVGYAAFPLASFLLLALECRRVGVSWRTGQPLVEQNAAFHPCGGMQTRPCAEAAQENCAALDAETTPKDGEACEEGCESGHVKSIGKLMVTVAVFSFLVRMFDMLPTYGSDPFQALGGSSLFALVIAGAAFLVVALIPDGKLDTALVYRISVPVMTLGFAALVMFFEETSAVSLLLIGVGYEFFDVLAWVLFADLARRDKRGVAYIYGYGVAAMFTGMAAGILAGSVMHAQVFADASQMSVLALACIVSLVVTSFMVLPESVLSQITARTPIRQTARSEAKTPEISATPPQQPETTLEDACAQVATDGGLTPRESEILVFLARGRTISIIARDLQIAKGTARTHAERIYRKLDVHKQQEIIDMVEQRRTEDADMARPQA